MAIDINKINGNPLYTNGGGKNTARDQASAEGSTQHSVASAAQSDRLVVSETAAWLHDLDTRLTSTPEVDEQRVEHLRHEIKEGTLTINASRVAEKLMRFERALGM